MDDALDRRGQVLVCLSLLFVKLVSIVNTTHAADDVAEASA
jgi:hypothetical protein